MKRTLGLLMALLVTITASVWAATDYTITDYRMDVVASDANVLSVTETIDVYFSMPRHGIYRSIPIRFGDKRVGVSHLQSTVPMTRDSVSDDYLTFRLGDANRYVQGAQRYVISYQYAIGDDRNPAYDELLYDLLGTSWECPIERFSFSVIMPHPVDPTRIWVAVGAEGSDTPGSFTVSSDRLVVSGSAQNLGEGKGLNLRIELPEGYFASVVKEKDWSTLATGVSLLSALIVIALTIWLFLRYGRDDPVIPVVRFDAPQGLSPMDVGYLSDGSVDPKDLSAMVFYWADKGCLSISLPQKKLFQSQEYVFTKIKEPEGGQPYEQDFFDAFFRCGTDGVVRLSEMKSTRFSKDVTAVKAAVKYRFSHGENALQDGKADRVKAIAGILSFLPVLVSVVAVEKGFLDVESAQVLLLGIISVGVASVMARFIASWSLTVSKARLFLAALVGIVVTFICFGGVGYSLYQEGWKGVVIALSSTVLSAFAATVSAFIGRRSPYGVKVLGETLGYREFIATAKIEQLKMMIDQNPQLYYHVLSYAIVFGLEKKWARKFQGIMVENPAWCDGPAGSLGDAMVLGAMIGSLQSSVTRNLYAQAASTPRGPIHSSFGGGGFVGGGFGGGGGGAW